MPTAKLVQIEAWSFSRWRDYEKCPLLAKFKHIERRKEPGSAAMDRGGDVHKLAEKYALGQMKNMPEELQRFEQEFKQLVKDSPKTEQEWAFTKDWIRTGWFDKNAWLRIKMDAHYVKGSVVYVIDHKTGKPKPDDDPLQIELYHLGALLMYPDCTKVVAKLWYLDQGTEEVVEVKNTPTQVEKLKKIWLKRTRAMLNDTRFAPTPGNHCSWCHFSQRKGGPCEN